MRIDNAITYSLNKYTNNMALKKGVVLNPNGRPQGSPNKSTTEIRNAFQMLVSQNSELMPILLRETSILHYEFMKYATRCMDKAIQQKFNGLLLYQSLYDNYEDQPVIGIANERQNRPLVIDGLLIEVYSANGINPKNIEL